MAETAIVIVVPEAEALVEILRRRHTADGAEGMPAHITLLYPFSDAELLVTERIDKVREALDSFAPFDAQLIEAARFRRRLDHVLWLAPRPAERLIAMTRTLAAAFPELPPYGGEFESVIPHLTVAVSADCHLLDGIEADLVKRLPIDMRVEQVAIYEHTADGWRLLTQIPLEPGSPRGS